MFRKIKRSIARHNIEQMDISIFGKYGTKNDVPVRNKRTGRIERKDMTKSFFSRNWRAYL